MLTMYVVLYLYVNKMVLTMLVWYIEHVEF